MSIAIPDQLQFRAALLPLSRKHLRTSSRAGTRLGAKAPSHFHSNVAHQRSSKFSDAAHVVSHKHNSLRPDHGRSGTQKIGKAAQIEGA